MTRNYSEVFFAIGFKKDLFFKSSEASKCSMNFSHNTSISFSSIAAWVDCMEG